MGRTWGFWTIARPEIRYPALMNHLFARFAVSLLLCASLAFGASHRFLFVKATYGFRHAGSIDAAIALLQQLAQQSGAFEIDHTEDVSLFTPANLRTTMPSTSLPVANCHSPTSRKPTSSR